MKNKVGETGERRGELGRLRTRPPSGFGGAAPQAAARGTPRPLPEATPLSDRRSRYGRGRPRPQAKPRLPGKPRPARRGPKAGGFPSGAAARSPPPAGFASGSARGPRSWRRRRGERGAHGAAAVRRPRPGPAAGGSRAEPGAAGDGQTDHHLRMPLPGRRHLRHRQPGQPRLDQHRGVRG